MNAETWYYVQDGASVGPLPRATMDALIRAGTIRPDTLVSPGYGDWVAANSTALGSSFGGAPIPGQFPPPPPPVPSPSPWKKDYLPKDPNTRRIVQVVIGAVGIYAMYSGVMQMKAGMGELKNDNSVQLTGCRGISAEALQCNFQNMAQESRTMCLDVVIQCNDGRHVASTCSDPIPGGASSMKLVNNFSPAINGTMTCMGVTYENVKTKG